MGRAINLIGEAATKRASSSLRHNSDPSLVRSVVGTAAGTAAVEAAKYVGEQHSIVGIAAMLGVQAKEAYQVDGQIPFYLKAPVSTKDRKEFGYGELPDVLINGVTRVVLRLGSDQMSPEPIKKLSARVMATMWDHKEKRYSSGTIPADSLHERLANSLSEEPIFTPGSIVEPDVLATYGAAIDLSYFLTAQYLERQASFPQAVAEMTEAV
jgi:hypothetical protein